MPAIAEHRPFQYKPLAVVSILCTILVGVAGVSFSSLMVFAATPWLSSTMFVIANLTGVLGGEWGPAKLEAARNVLRTGKPQVGGEFDGLWLSIDTRNRLGFETHPEEPLCPEIITVPAPGVRTRWVFQWVRLHGALVAVVLHAALLVSLSRDWLPAWGYLAWLPPFAFLAWGVVRGRQAEAFTPADFAITIDPYNHQFFRRAS